MKVVAEVRGRFIVDVDIEAFHTVDEIETAIQDLLRSVRLCNKLEVWLPAEERGALLEELKKNNS